MKVLPSCVPLRLRRALSTFAIALSVVPLAAIGAEPDEVVFAVRQPGSDPHWYANFGYYCQGPQRPVYTRGGKLCKLDLRSGKVTNLVDDPEGGVRDPHVDYDGRRIVFSYRPGSSPHYHLYSINSDGSGLRQLTDGPFDDVEPACLPDGGIVFCSSRRQCWVKCWLVQVATLYRCDGDGGNVRALSSSDATENTPCVLPDGRILYTRWEYVDRSQVHYHHLWTMNPDGTGQAIFYGNFHPGTVMVDSRPIPASREIVSIFSPGHGQTEHCGAVTLVDPASGPDVLPAARALSRDQRFRDPYPLAADRFLVARRDELLRLDGAGKAERVYQLGDEDRRAGRELHEPIPLAPREREPAIASRVNLAATTGKVVLANVYAGRHMDGVKPGEIKKLLVLESLPKPINYTGGMDPLTYGGSFSLERVVGTVPVEADGSAYAELPALRSLFFVALDENDLAVKRMQSFISLQPGETLSCAGCHEQRSRTALPRSDLRALARPASAIEPIRDVPEVFDFPRDIQPILNRLCVDCHDYRATPRGGPRAGGIVLAGDRGPMYSHGYFTLTVTRLFSDGRNDPQSNYAPRRLGSAASRILTMLDGQHHGVQATPLDRKRLRLWIETAATYPGTYAALGTGTIGAYQENTQVQTDHDWPTTRAGAAVIARRCGACHDGPRALPRRLSDERHASFWRPEWGDRRLKYSRHIVFNLSRPELSLVLLAPLAKAAGGLGECRKLDAQGNPGEPAGVFAGPDDPDYQTLLDMCRAGARHLEKIKRFDMPGFRPRPEYVREMRRYGVLSGPLADAAPLDPYALDEAYWRSLWHQPVAAGPGAAQSP